MGAYQVVVYHGSNREEAIEELKTADVVITTYSIVEAEYRKETSPSKVRRPYMSVTHMDQID